MKILTLLLLVFGPLGVFSQEIVRSDFVRSSSPCRCVVDFVGNANPQGAQNACSNQETKQKCEVVGQGQQGQGQGFGCKWQCRRPVTEAVAEEVDVDLNTRPISFP